MIQQTNLPYTPDQYHTAGVYRLNVGPYYYLGSTTSLGGRRSSHKQDLAQGKHPNKKLQAAWDEYGDFEFLVLELVPTYQARDRGRDHSSRLKFREQLLLDLHISDDYCCNASADSRYNTQVGGNIKRLWADPEWRARRQPTLKPRKPVTPETRARMAEAKRGAKSPKARGCWIDLPGTGRSEYACVTDAARALGVKQQILHSWLTGGSAWPGTGGHPPRPANRHLIGLTGGYLPKTEPVAPEAPAWATKCDPYGECEILRAHDTRPVVYPTIAAAAKAIRVSHLQLYRWLSGEEPWPTADNPVPRKALLNGLTGRMRPR